MSKFNIGDEVVGNGSASGQYSVTITGWKGIVKDTYIDVFGREIIKVNGKGGNFDVDERYFSLVEPAKRNVAIIRKLSNL